MAIYAIGDLHLSVDGAKPMDIFSGWENHQQRLLENWNKLVGPDDTVVLAGDTSWGMTLEQARADFAFIHSLPDEKIIRREGIRIEASLRAADGDGERILFLHYPPVYAGQVQEMYLELMQQHGIKRCYYGHIHGAGHKNAFQGDFRGVLMTEKQEDYS